MHPKQNIKKKVTDADESQLDMTKKLELPHDRYIELENDASFLGLDVFSTPFDLDSIDFLYSQKQKTWKIPSGELLNLPYIEKIAKLPIDDKRIIISTGMSTIDEIKLCLSVFDNNGVPKSNITILHCNTEYPTPFGDVNLSVISSYKKIFPEYNIGFSDHSPGFLCRNCGCPFRYYIYRKTFYTR